MLPSYNEHDLYIYLVFPFFVHFNAQVFDRVMYLAQINWGFPSVYDQHQETSKLHKPTLVNEHISAAFALFHFC